MNTNELTADYICKEDDRLQMALHIYEAMPAVRKYLIKDIFKAAGERVRDAEEFDGDQLWCYDEEVSFYTEETGDFYVYAKLAHGNRGVLQLVAGVYADDEKSFKKQRDEIRERFRTKGGLETWSYGENALLSGTSVYAEVHYELGGRWHDDDFLQRAIRNREEVVEALAEILLGIYRGVFLDAAQES